MIAEFGAEATADTLLSLLTWVGVQHVLAHGLTDPGNPLQSGLMMAADGRLPPAKATPRTTPFLPGFVSAAELAAEAIVANHVTIQACSLGLAVPGAGEEFWGVTRSLLLGGTSTVIAPLWDVSPASSTALLADFYRRWLGAGQPRWRAWAEAQREMYTSSPQAWQHYYHWAPFRLVGVPSGTQCGNRIRRCQPEVDMVNAVRTRLAELEEGQAAEVLRALLARIEDRPPAATEDELATQREEDEAFLATLPTKSGSTDLQTAFRPATILPGHYCWRSTTVCLISARPWTTH